MTLSRMQLLTAAGFDRDIADNIGPAMGGLHFEEPGTETTIATPGEFTKAANDSTLHSAYQFSMPVANRIQYDGSQPARAAITATLSFTCALNNQVLAFGIAVNGILSMASIVSTKVTTGTDVQAVTVMTHPTLKPGDYAEVWVTNNTSTGGVTITHGHIHAMAFYP